MTETKINPEIHCAHDELKNLAELVEHPRNPNKHSDQQIQMLAKIIAAQGWRAPIVLSNRSGFIVAGHARLKAAYFLGLESAPVNLQDFKNEAEETAHLIADNRIAELAEIDNAALKDLLIELDTGENDMDLTGFDTASLEDLMTQFNPEDEDGEPLDNRANEFADKWGTQRGQLWRLGEHLILCGDAQNDEDIKCLFGDSRADMVLTDPPYGIAYDNLKRWSFSKKQSDSARKGRGAEIEGDSKPFNPSFILETFSGVKEVFIWGFQYFPQHLGRGGIIVWNRKLKEQEECPWTDFELCWSKQERNLMAWFPWGGWQSKEPGEERLHTTQKPIALMEWFLKRWSKQGQIIADIFLGSGTVLIACENLGRKCRGMEIDPGYFATTLERWHLKTGGKPELLN